MMVNGLAISSAAVRCPKHGGEQSREQLVELDATQLVHMGRPVLTYVTIAVTAAVVIYLFAALVRPEWF